MPEAVRVRNLQFRRFEGGKGLDTNYDTYELPRFSWLAKIETVFMD